ncbi:DUF294 nucleotidyltransferase-like domain-containing protein [Bacillus dakarensis]|uniref:DUF294 nucleotidyltransferase-like domain-containing protein n=1 Tax=Robertmurraya dakarensis TaxID=1926278 RepID=UPI0009826230|nr:DUF294 nucleotidyltransferase-like domain-containing protein [Bacillus dakarensis]
MGSAAETYENIKQWKEENISLCLNESDALNKFHDMVMKRVFDIAIAQLGKGNPPCPYSWFVTGSGGRFEQSIISDQDHGIIYEVSSEENNLYFKELGNEIAYGLNEVGYPYCQGNVMCSNPRWRKSRDKWKEQLLQWMEEGSWESIRNLQIFYDARTLTGEIYYVHDLKGFIYEYQKEHPRVLKRLMDNVKHIKNVIGPLGQLMVEGHGIHQGKLDLKYSAFLPYVNAIRLLSIKEGLKATSTIHRINGLINANKKYGPILTTSKNNFIELLKYRFSFHQGETYEGTHFLDVDKLSKSERKEIKRIIKDGKKLHNYVCNLIEKGDNHGI